MVQVDTDDPDFHTKVTGKLTSEGGLDCTCTLVGPNVAITAAHCLRTLKDDVYDLDQQLLDSAQITFGKGGEDSASFSVTAAAYDQRHLDLRTAGESKKAAQYDYLLLVLEAPAGYSYGWAKVLDFGPEDVD